MRPLAIVLVLLIALLSSTAGVSAQVRWEQRVPANAKVTLTSDKTSYFIGENIQLHYHVTNTGGPDFKVSSGGDNGAGGRSERFVVIAKDEEQIAADDPQALQAYWGFGGMSPTPTVTPQKPWAASLQLMAYCEIRKPGIYTIHVWHDLGWTAEHHHLDASQPMFDDADKRWTTLKLTIKQPEAEDAARIFASRMAMNADAKRVADSESKPHADFRYMNDPAYLPMLNKAAVSGNDDAVAGIISIHTPQATRVLMALLTHPDDKIASGAAYGLRDRLPSSPMPIGWRRLKKEVAQRQKLVDASWREDMSRPLLDHARAILKQPTRSRLMYADTMLASEAFASIASPGEIGTVIESLDILVKQIAQKPSRDGQEPYQLSWVRTLAFALLKRGAVAPASPRSLGEIVVYLEALKLETAGLETTRLETTRLETARLEASETDTTKRGTENIEASKFVLLDSSKRSTYLTAWLKHDIAYVRGLAVQALRLPLEPWARKPVLSLLEGSEYPAEIGALLNAISKSPDPMFAQASLDVINEVDDKSVLDNATRAAKASGVTDDVIMLAWAERLIKPDGKRPNHAARVQTLSTLLDVLEGYMGLSGKFFIPEQDRPALHKRWVTFIHANQHAIRHGRKIPISDPTFTSELVPEGFVISIEKTNDVPAMH